MDKNCHIPDLAHAFSNVENQMVLQVATIGYHTA